jgi:hypothetical protein
MLQAQVDALEGQGLDLDLSEIGSFEHFTSHMRLEPAHLQSVLADYYGMQLRQYQQLSTRLERMRKRVSKVEKMVPRYESSILRLSPRLRKRFLQVQGLEEELATWTKYAESAEQQADTAEEYHGFVQDLSENKISPDLEFPDPPEIVRGFSNDEREALKKAEARARELCDSVKGSSEEQANLLIAEKIQGIRDALARVDWT